MTNSRYRDENGVFKNKLDITDSKELQIIEYDYAARRARQWEFGNHCDLKFDFERQKAIHKSLLGDVYEWAGQQRTTPLNKAVPGPGEFYSKFADPDKIEADWKALEAKITEFLAIKTDFEGIRERLVDIFTEANRIHPFPEGNGRSLQVFMRDLAKEKGMVLDYSLVTKEQWNLASAASGTLLQRIDNDYYAIRNDLRPIREVFERIAKPSIQGLERNIVYFVGQDLPSKENVVKSVQANPDYSIEMYRNDRPNDKRVPLIAATVTSPDDLSKAAVKAAFSAPNLKASAAAVQDQFDQCFNEPKTFAKALKSALPLPRATFDAKINALLENPSAFGGLRGSDSLFTKSSEKEQRATALSSLAPLRSEISFLKDNFDQTVKTNLAQFNARGALFSIEIPCLSEPASAALLECAKARDPLKACEALSQNPEISQELTAFAGAVQARFGNGMQSSTTLQNAMPDGSVLSENETALVRAGGLFANFIQRREQSPNLVHNVEQGRGPTKGLTR